MEQPKGDAYFLMTIRYVSRFRSRFTVSIGAILFSLMGLRDFEHYAFAWMDSGFYRPIIKLASAHLLDCELGERSSRLECCRKLQDTVYCSLKFGQYLFRCASVNRKEESAFLLSQASGGFLNQIR